MTSVTAFNDMMGQFLTELHSAFPEEKGLKKYMAAFELMRGANGRMIVEGFMANITPHVEKINARDETFFLQQAGTIDFLKELNIKSYWTRMSTGTKDATWQYLQTLYMLGTTITSIPADTLNLIEGIAKDCAEKMETEGGELDQAALMKMMGSMLGGLPKK